MVGELLGEEDEEEGVREAEEEDGPVPSQDCRRATILCFKLVGAEASD